MRMSSHNYVTYCTWYVTGTAYTVPSYSYIHNDYPTYERIDIEWPLQDTELCRPHAFRPMHKCPRFSIAEKLRWLRLDVRDVPKDYPAPKTSPQPFPRTQAAWAVALRSFR